MKSKDKNEGCRNCENGLAIDSSCAYRLCKLNSTYYENNYSCKKWRIQE
jgi:hypothetical protein